MSTNQILPPEIASRRYQTQAVIGTVLFIVLVTCIAGPAREGTHGPWRTIVALLPMLPLIWTFWAVVQYLGRADELVRRVNLEALAVAAGFTAFLSLAYGLLEDLAGFPHIALWWIFVAVDLFWALAALILWRRYQ